MASPQKEDGYTAIANELMDSLCKIRINGEARQVLDFIFRKTYGYNKKQDAISLSQFAKGTNMRKDSVCKALSKLKSMNIIGEKANEIATIYLIIKDYTLWKPLAKKPRGLAKKPIPLTKKEIGLAQIAKKSSPNSPLHKQVLKDNTTKDILLRNTEQSSETTTDLVYEPLEAKKEFGSKLINDMTSVVLEVSGISSLDGSVPRNRQFAHHVAGKIKKEFVSRSGREPTDNEIVSSLRAILLKADKFNSNKITNFNFIFYHFGELILGAENKKSNFVTI